MKLQSHREETLTNSNNSSNFGFNVNAKAVQILSSGIYERKIEAVIRELSCNASDSHVEAGKKDVPFYVGLPTSFEPTFVVEDFGIGLNDDDVRGVPDEDGVRNGGIFNTYFDSTKTESNDVIGALGLGSKSPYSYTDSFTLRTRKDGVEYHYTCYMDSDGLPKTDKMFEIKTTKPNGVRVEVGVEHKDVREFVDTAKNVLSWFKVRPDTNFKIDYKYDKQILDSLEEKGYHIEAKGRFSRGSHPKSLVIMGNVAYTVDLSALDFSKYEECFSDFITHLQNNYDLYLEIPLGDADVAASRETLSLDTYTKANLAKHLEKVYDNFAKDVKAKMDTMESVIEADKSLMPIEKKCVQDYKIDGFCLRDLGTTRTFSVGDFQTKYLDYPNLSSLDCAFYGPYTDAFTRSYKSSVFKRLYDLGKSFVVNLPPMKVVVNDCEKKMGLVSATSYEIGRCFLIQTPKTSVSAVENEIKKFFLNHCEIIAASSFWDGEATKRTSGKSSLTQTQVQAYYVEPSGSYDYKTRDLSGIDKSRWVVAESRKMGIDNDTHLRLGDKYLPIGSIRGLLAIFDLDGVIGYNKTNVKKVKRIVDQDLTEYVKKNLTLDQLKPYAYSKVKEEMNLRSVSMEMQDGFKEFRDEVVEESNKVDGRYRFLLSVLSKMNSDVEKEFNDFVKKKVDSLRDFEHDARVLRDNFPIVKLLERSSPETWEVESVKEYIEFKKKGGKV